MTEIFKVLSLSTGHVPEDDLQWLISGLVEEVIAYPYEYGVWIYVPSDTETFKETIDSINHSNFSQALINCMKHAYSNDCRYIQLDRDGDVNSDLESFDWLSSKHG